jgi:hypothetical protein
MKKSHPLLLKKALTDYGTRATRSVFDLHFTKSQFEWYFHNKSNALKAQREKYDIGHKFYWGMTTLATARDMRDSKRLLISLGLKDAQGQEYLDASVEIFNSQLCWGLARAFEDYEWAILELYAVAGYIDKNYWQAADYGLISIKEASKKPIKWLHETARKTIGKHGVRDIISRFRKNHTIISEYENDNFDEVNYRFIMELIEISRHVTVLYTPSRVQNSASSFLANSKLSMTQLRLHRGLENLDADPSK